MLENTGFRSKDIRKWIQKWNACSISAPPHLTLLLRKSEGSQAAGKPWASKHGCTQKAGYHQPDLTANSQPAISLSPSKQKWVTNFQSAGLAWATRHAWLWAHSEHKAKGCNKSNPFIRLQAEIRAGDTAADRAPVRGTEHSTTARPQGIRECFAQ